MSEAAFASQFLSHPAFAVFDPIVRERLAALPRFPEPAEIARLTRGIPTALPPWFSFSQQDSAALQAAGSFDRLIAHTSHIPTRPGSFHDLLGALIWLHFPALKSAVHRTQLAGDARARGPAENAATHLDESGVLVLSQDPALFQALAELKWLDALWHERAALQESTRFLTFGHGLLDSLREPHPRLMGKALFVRVKTEHLALSAPELRVLVDHALAERLLPFLANPSRLQPLPVLGVPGWWPAQSRAYYEDTRYFQTARKRARPHLSPAWIEL